jgi:hypothetical protein
VLKVRSKEQLELKGQQEQTQVLKVLKERLKVLKGPKVLREDKVLKGPKVLRELLQL